MVIYLNNNIISWRSKKQSNVALSTMEAEYSALCLATQNTIWLQHLIAELGLITSQEPVIYCDNQAAIKLSKNDMITNRAKHIEIKMHFIRNQVKFKKIQLKYINTENNIADIFTKNVTRQKFYYFIKFIISTISNLKCNST